MCRIAPRMPHLLRYRVFLLESIFQQSIQRIDLPHFILFIERFDGDRLGVIGFGVDDRGSCGGM